jgi:soluble lytic murein transglycosylase
MRTKYRVTTLPMESGQNPSGARPVPARVLRYGLLLVLSLPAQSWAADAGDSRIEAEYYVTAYAKHYRLPVEFVRAIVEQESGWHRCPVSPKGAMGLMQLMPATAARLNVRNRCDLNQNVSGGVRYLTWLRARFHGDLRLVAAAYYAGERTIDKRGLKYSNSDVVHYVASIRQRFERQRRVSSVGPGPTPRRRQ